MLVAKAPAPTNVTDGRLVRRVDFEREVTGESYLNR